MEAQLEEKNKELQQVCVLTGRPRLGGRRSLDGGQCCLSPRLPFSAVECVHVWPHLLIRAPTSLGTGPEVVTHRRWAGARASSRSKRLLVALTSQSGELLGIQVDLMTAPQTNLRVPALGP